MPEFSTARVVSHLRLLHTPLLPSAGPELWWRGELQPVPLHRSRVVFHGRRVWSHLEPADQVYRDELRTLWRASGIRAPLRGPLGCVMAFAGRRGRRPDLTNLLKAVEDAGNGFLWEDDCQIRLLLGWIEGWGPEVEPFVEVAAWRLGEG